MRFPAFRIYPAVLAVLVLWSLAGQASEALATAPVRSTDRQPGYGAEGVVEAVRHTPLSVQAAGRITVLPVKPGDLVKAGQLLVRVDAMAAEREAAASGAQAEAARATLDIARKNYQRQQQLFAQHFVSQAALDLAQAQFRSAEAQTRAQLASAGAARAQLGFFSITAPYDGVVADVPANLGETALPGRALVSVYDPTRLRVTANVAQTRLASISAATPVRIEIPGHPKNRIWQNALRLEILPTADTGTHTVQIRAYLPPDAGPIIPGAFARVWLPVQEVSAPRLYIPSSAIFRRAELPLVYVVDSQSRPHLRQVKIGRPLGRETEILAGLSPGEQVAVDPLAAAGR